MNLSAPIFVPDQQQLNGGSQDPRDDDDLDQYNNEAYEHVF